jgi:hypothetical protein
MGTSSTDFFQLVSIYISGKAVQCSNTTTALNKKYYMDCTLIKKYYFLKNQFGPLERCAKALFELRI